MPNFNNYPPQTPEDITLTAVERSDILHASDIYAPEVISPIARMIGSTIAKSVENSGFTAPQVVSRVCNNVLDEAQETILGASSGSSKLDIAARFRSGVVEGVIEEMDLAKQEAAV